MKIYIKSSGEDITYKELKSKIYKATTQTELENAKGEVVNAYKRDMIAKGDYNELMHMVGATRYEMYELFDEIDDEPYTPSAARGDYSPSDPWNAPGMSVSDFI